MEHGKMEENMKKMPEFLKEELALDVESLEKMLERINVSLTSFLRLRNCRKILRARFPKLAEDVGWEYLENKAKGE